MQEQSIVTCSEKGFLQHPDWSGTWGESELLQVLRIINMTVLNLNPTVGLCLNLHASEDVEHLQIADKTRECLDRDCEERNAISGQVFLDITCPGNKSAIQESSFEADRAKLSIERLSFCCQTRPLIQGSTVTSSPVPASSPKRGVAAAREPHLFKTSTSSL